MSTVIGNAARYPLKAAKKEKCVATAVAVNTAGGGVINQASSRYSDPGIVITRVGVGLYTIAYPACPGDVQFQVGVHFNSGAPNVFDARITAYSATAGTATLSTDGATPGTPVDGAAGEEIHLTITADISSGS